MVPKSNMTTIKHPGMSKIRAAKTYFEAWRNRYPLKW